MWGIWGWLFPIVFVVPVFAILLSISGRFKSKVIGDAFKSISIGLCFAPTVAENGGMSHLVLAVLALFSGENRLIAIICIILCSVISYFILSHVRKEKTT